MIEYQSLANGQIFSYVGDKDDETVKLMNPKNKNIRYVKKADLKTLYKKL